MLKRTLHLLCMFMVFNHAYSQSFDIKSPNEDIQVKVTIDDGISWSASLGGNVIIKDAQIGMNFSTGADFGTNPHIKKHKIESFSSTIYPVVPHKDAAIKDDFVQLSLTFKGNYQLKIRAYNDGVAYQFVDNGKSDRDVMAEKISLTFPEGAESIFPKEDQMYSHNERFYLDKKLADLSSDDFCSLPVVFITDKAKVLLTETALHDYPGMFVRGNGNTTVDAIFPKYALEVIDNASEADRSQIITQKAAYIAKVSGQRDYPWRVFIISDDDRTFVESNLTFQLSKPLALENTDWIKPGKVAWDWYNANNIYDVDFKSGLNTATYKYYIDFASTFNIEYVILDEGWTKSTTEILDFNPDIDVHELIRYGKEKNVEIILWTLWKPLDANLVKILETYKSWGAKGIKVDFMQRNDQYMVNSYEQIAKECAKLELLVDFHGAFKPSGLRRAYPNVINYEGVKGSENNKWSKDITPEHNLTLPFIRMAAGPMDYTPGAMSNRHAKDFTPSFERPMSIGTRAHQVAMYVVYEAPLQMLCESPSRYYKEQETVEFIVKIPTTWDETIVLHGVIGDYIAVARRKGNKWYVGAMTDKTSRTLEIDLSFLQEGTFKMEVFKDGINADRFAEDYKIDTTTVNQNSKVKAEMTSGGGWAAIISVQGEN
ncbi:MAG: glycoside hydrolase family 97 protein [Bacteroidales bacterium]|jgi:alpha-glucosidase|nr:glycoside hydrolase family 97 protein [Bacteroidales bacterium]